MAAGRRCALDCGQGAAERLAGALVAAACLLLFAGGCSTVAKSAAAQIMLSQQKIEAVKFPELVMKDRSGLEQEVKILSVRGRMVTVTRFPYWVLDPVEIPIDDIVSLRVKRKSYPGLTVTMVCMEAGFILAGSTMGAAADNRRQYGLAIGLGVGGALLGAGAAFFSDVWELGEEMYPEYYLGAKPAPEKLLVILEIMGFS